MCTRCLYCLFAKRTVGQAIGFCRLPFGLATPQPFEESSFRLASSADPAATMLLFQRSVRGTETPRSWLTVSNGFPLQHAAQRRFLHDL
jgi:hypothetical protein